MVTSERSWYGSPQSCGNFREKLVGVTPELSELQRGACRGHLKLCNFREAGRGHLKLCNFREAGRGHLKLCNFREELVGVTSSCVTSERSL